MNTCGRCAAMMLLLSLPLAAEAHGFRRSSQSVTYYAYYPATIVYVPVLQAVPALVGCVPAATPAVAPKVYATPTPAPPLGAPTPATPPPAVKETRNYFDVYAVAGREGQRMDGQRCQVGFWNNTNRELVLKVQGQSWTLPANQGRTLELPRDFLWQVENRESRQERVPPDQAGMEIVIRR